MTHLGKGKDTLQANDYIVIFITAGSEPEGEKIARGLTEKRLVACVNIIPKIRSIYWWEGKLCNDEEVLLIAKSRRNLFPEICQMVKELHSYQIPEIISFSMLDGSKDYLQWVKESVL
jgi:periplasmic divalent cation tolerance protein